jgi:hypothetical protein
MAIDSASSVPSVPLVPSIPVIAQQHDGDIQPPAAVVSAETRVYRRGDAPASPASDTITPLVVDVEASVSEAVAQVSRASGPAASLPVDASAAAASYTAESAAQAQPAAQPKTGTQTDSLA